MSSRVTREHLEQEITLLNRICEARDLPDRYELSIWSPGDGWTRYQLVIEGGHREVSQVCTIREMFDALYTLIRVLERF